MAKTNKMKWNLYFHNPNKMEEIAYYIVKILVEANRGKVEEVINKEVEKK